MAGATRQACSPSGDTENDLRPDGISMIIGRKPHTRRGPERAITRTRPGRPAATWRPAPTGPGTRVVVWQRRLPPGQLPDALKVLQANLTNGQTALAAPARKQTPGRRNRHLGRPHAVIVPGRRVKRMVAG